MCDGVGGNSPASHFGLAWQCSPGITALYWVLAFRGGLAHALQLRLVLSKLGIDVDHAASSFKRQAGAVVPRQARLVVLDQRPVVSPSGPCRTIHLRGITVFGFHNDSVAS